MLTDEQLGGGHLSIARAALRGGAAIIQLRDKSTPLRALLPIAYELRRITRESGALLILNDRIDITLAVEADGVHLGPDDLPVHEARRILGPHRLIGASCGNAEEAGLATQAGADYVGAGAIYGTATKADAGAPIGIQGLREILQATNLPVAAIGGVNMANVREVIDAGAVMACVISAITSAGDEEGMTSATRRIVEAATFAVGE